MNPLPGACSALALAAAISGATAAAETARPLPNGGELVRSVVDRQRSFEKAIDDYTYDVLATEEKLDDKDRVEERHVRRLQAFFVNGVPIRRLIEKDGRPLSPAEAEKEEKRVVKAAREARSRQRSQKDEADAELRISDVLLRYDFTAVAREEIDGRDAVLVTFHALPGKRDIKRDNVFRALEGRLWIDEEARAVIRAELRSNQKIKIMGGIAASISSVELSIDFVPVDLVWLPRRTQGFASGRVLLLKKFRGRVTEDYSHYRRFVVSSDETVLGPHP